MASGFRGASNISHIRLRVFAYYDWETDGEFIAGLRDKQPPRNTKRLGINGVPCLSLQLYQSAPYRRLSLLIISAPQNT